MSKEKLMPGECIMPDDGAPICNVDGEIVRKNMEDETQPDPEEMEMDDGKGFFRKIWEKTP